MKKGAMFGLDCRALKKQFGELFLASRQSEAPQGASGSCGYTKRGAMFGLDARIALAIFGALSVISGAALYSAIQESKAMTLLVDMKEMGKAWEQYYLDIGSNLPKISTDSSSPNFYTLNSLGLTSDTGDSNWKGPYLSKKTGSYVSQNVYTLDDTDWNSWNNGYCTSGEQCYIWVYFTGIDQNFPLEVIDLKVDGEVDSRKGSFRYGYGADIYKNRVYLKYAPIENPHD